MTTGLLVHRATTIGLPLLAGSVLLIVVGIPTARQRAAGISDRPRLVFLSGLAGALLAPFHFFFFPVVPLLVLAWVAVGRPAVRAGGRAARPPVRGPVPARHPVRGGRRGPGHRLGLAEARVGWQTAPLNDGPLAVLFFYAHQPGHPVRPCPGGACPAPNARPARSSRLWIGLLFLIPNVVQVSYVSFDMNKYFQAMWIAVAIAAGTAARALADAACRRPARRSALLSPVLSSVHHALSRNFLLSADQLAAAAWIADNTPERSVFVTDDWIISPTDPAGRLRLTTFGPYVANLGYDPLDAPGADRRDPLWR